MLQPEDPPSFIVRVELQKAAAHNGFRLERGIARGWMRFESTVLQVGIWIAGITKHGPWLLSVDRIDIAIESGLPTSPLDGPGVASFIFESLQDLYAGLDGFYRLASSLPDAPLKEFEASTTGMSRETEAERLAIQRVGQDVFRKALLAYWGGQCPLTGIRDAQLLRASHIVPWAQCDTDNQRLDVHNGLLLSALWDAAFDAGLVSFADDGSPLYSALLTPDAAANLMAPKSRRLAALTAVHRANLQWHRTRYGF
jgi:hypothetical protein